MVCLRFFFKLRYGGVRHPIMNKAAYVSFSLSCDDFLQTGTKIKDKGHMGQNNMGQR